MVGLLLVLVFASFAWRMRKCGPGGELTNGQLVSAGQLARWARNFGQIRPTVFAD